MTFLIYILFGIAFLLLIFQLSIYSALNRLFRFKKIVQSELKISIVIAAKNEANNIPNLIKSLLNQNYSKDKFEVIIVDDNSIDDTFEVAKKLIINLNNFSVVKAVNKIFQAKKGTLDIGIKLTNNPYILITDADCEPGKEWINSFAMGFENKHDFLFGIAPYRATSSFSNLIARFENLRANIIVFAFAKLGLPYSASARSFGFSREAFNKTSGYKNTTETLSGDDDLLLREAIKHNLKIGMITDPDAFVLSNTKESLSDYINQKSRHTSTSVHYSTGRKFLLGSWHLLNIVSIFSILALPISNVFIFPFFIKLVIDIFILNNFQNNFGYKLNPIWFLLLQINYELSLVYFFFNGLKFTNRWE
jgi:glycosyltransferase involved in cell wall biosynthesis